MKANAIAQAPQTTTAPTAKGGQISDPAKVPHIAKGPPETALPDYSSMRAEIEKVKDPVPFEELKKFYDLD